MYNTSIYLSSGCRDFFQPKEMLSNAYEIQKSRIKTGLDIPIIPPWAWWVFRNQQNQRKRCKQWGNKLVGGWKVWNLVTDDSKGKLSKWIVQIFCLVNSNLHDPVFPQMEVKPQKALPQISGAHSYGHKPDGLAKFVFSWWALQAPSGLVPMMSLCASAPSSYPAK